MPHITLHKADLLSAKSSPPASCCACQPSSPSPGASQCARLILSQTWHSSQALSTSQCGFSLLLYAFVIPDLQGFEEKRKVMNAACTAQPAVIVVPNFDQDVSTIIKAAKANNIELSVRSGGHSYTCTNIKEGGLHMDMRSAFLE